MNDFLVLTPCSKIIQMDNWIQKYIKEMNLSSLDELLLLIDKDQNYLNDFFNSNMSNN